MHTAARTYPTFDGELTAAQIYVECRRRGGFNAATLTYRDDDWASLTSALRRIAAREGLSVSTHTERRQGWGHRPTQQVQIHKDNLLAYYDTPAAADAAAAGSATGKAT